MITTSRRTTVSASTRPCSRVCRAVRITTTSLESQWDFMKPSNPPSRSTCVVSSPIQSVSPANFKRWATPWVACPFDLGFLSPMGLQMVLVRLLTTFVKVPEQPRQNKPTFEPLPSYPDGCGLHLSCCCNSPTESVGLGSSVRRPPALPREWKIIRVIAQRSSGWRTNPPPVVWAPFKLTIKIDTPCTMHRLSAQPTTDEDLIEAGNCSVQFSQARKLTSRAWIRQTHQRPGVGAE